MKPYDASIHMHYGRYNVAPMYDIQDHRIMIDFYTPLKFPDSILRRAQKMIERIFGAGYKYECIEMYIEPCNIVTNSGSYINNHVTITAELVVK